MVLSMHDISKTFPGVKALQHVDFTLRKGEIHALMGENGAGKSTLIKVLTGVHSFESGEILMAGSDGAIINRSPQEAQEHGLYTLIAYTNRSKEREEYYLNMASDTGFYGIIYTYAPRAVSSLNHLYEKLPLVLINDHNPDLKMELLELDSKKSGRLIAAHLLELGHRDIGYMTTPLSSIEVPRRRRLEGMQEEYERQGLDSSFIHVISGKREEQETITGNKHYDTGYGLTRKYFKKREDILKKKEETNAELENITAFVGTNDFVAIGIMDAITSLGYRIPEDFSVCGFDNTLVASFSGISLTTIDHCIGEKGAYAVSMLRNQRTRMEQKDDKKEKKRPIMRLEYEPQLIIRCSTGKRK